MTAARRPVSVLEQLLDPGRDVTFRTVEMPDHYWPLRAHWERIAAIRRYVNTHPHAKPVKAAKVLVQALYGTENVT